VNLSLEIILVRMNAATMRHRRWRFASLDESAGSRVVLRPRFALVFSRFSGRVIADHEGVIANYEHETRRRYQRIDKQMGERERQRGMA